MSGQTGWKMNLEELVSATSGRVLSQTSREFTGVGTDTRVDLKNQIFFALKGDAFDAHDFLPKAVNAGAGVLVVHRAPDQAILDQVTVVLVSDTLKALQDLGHFWRRKMPAKILGVTGTNGKTTTKEFAAAVIGSKYKVQYSKGSFNNHWGVPISLLSMTPSHEVAVIEMGMNHPGELTLLANIAEPDAVLCTMVGRGHLEGVGSIQGVADAKEEIYLHAPKAAIGIFNLGNPFTHAMYEKWRRVPQHSREQIMTFATKEEREKLLAALPAKEPAITVDVVFELVSVELDSLVVRGEIRGVAGEARVPVFGKQNVTNLMAAACFALVAGLTPEEIWKALPLCKTAWGRNQWVSTESGARVLFDGYNANPESMTAAVENFGALKTPGRKVALLGEMRELGAAAPEMHRELGALVAKSGFDAVVFIGPSGAEFTAGAASVGGQKNLFVSNTYEQSLAPIAVPVLDENDLVLIKGSRGMQLERILQDLKPVGFQTKT